MTPQEIREARKTLGLTQDALAPLIGYKSGGVRVSELERGRKTPPNSVIRLITVYLDGYRPTDWPKKDDCT